MASLALMATVIALLSGCPTWAGVAYGIGLSIKFQGISIIPVIAIIALRRHGRIGLSKAAGATFAVMAIISLPDALGGGINGVLSPYLGAVDHYRILASNCFNLWEIVYQFRLHIQHLPMDTALADDAPLFLHITAKQIALPLVVGYGLGLMLGIWRKPDRKNIVMATCLMGFAFFVLSTQMRQRYVIPAVAIGTPLVVLGELPFYLVMMLVAAINQGMAMLISNRETGDHLQHVALPHGLQQLWAICLTVFSIVNVILLGYGTWRYFQHNSRGDRQH